MKFEPGKYYRTRDGRKAYLSCIIGDNPFRQSNAHFPLCGFIDGYGFYIWNKDGTYCSVPSNRDLIAEWHEPVTQTAWVHLVRRKDGTCYRSTYDEKQPAEFFHPGTLIAVHQDTITEGEGMS